MPPTVTLTINGLEYGLPVTLDTTLLHVIREGAGLTGAKEGCDDSECGACVMLVDGRPTNAWSYLAVRADGAAIVTAEGIAAMPLAALVQKRFLERGAVQCGFCTSGMLIAAVALLDRVRKPNEEEVKVALSGNLCPCTGYQTIVSAISEARCRLESVGVDTGRLPLATCQRPTSSRRRRPTAMRRSTPSNRSTMRCACSC